MPRILKLAARLIDVPIAVGIMFTQPMTSTASANAPPHWSSVFRSSADPVGSVFCSRCWPEV